MKILLNYLKPYKWLVILTLFLAALNMGFSLLDPIIFGKIVNLSNEYVQARKLHHNFSAESFFTDFFLDPSRSNKSAAVFGCRCHDEPDREKFPGLFHECGGPEIRGESIYRWTSACYETSL